MGKRVRKLLLVLSCCFVLLATSACGLFDLSDLFPDRDADVSAGTSPSPEEPDTGERKKMYAYTDICQPDGLQNRSFQPHLISAAERESSPFRYLRDDLNTGLPEEKVGGGSASSDAEALFNAVSRGKLPVCAKNSWAQALYFEALKTLDCIITNDMTEYERVHAIYDWMIYCVQYDYDLLAEYEKNPNGVNANDPAFNMVGVFRDRVAVCDGLSQAFTLLCRIENIRCVRIVGTAGSATGGIQSPSNVGHAWNKVYIHKPDTNCADEQYCDNVMHRAWYICDPTWGNLAIVSSSAQVTPNYEVLVHNYLLVSDSEVRGTHFEYSGLQLTMGIEDANFTYEFPGSRAYPKAASDYGFYQRQPVTTKAGSVSSLKITSSNEMRIYIQYATENRLTGMEFKTSLGDSWVEAQWNSYYTGGNCSSVVIDDVYLFFK